jgi:transposase
MVLWHISAVLCQKFTVTPIMTYGPNAWPPRSPDLNPLHFYLWRQLKSLVYAAPVDNEEALHNRIVDACQTIRNYPGIFERMRRSMMRRVKVCIESHGGHFEQLL